MTVRYDDALPNLIRVATLHSVALGSGDCIVVRDAAGRLAIVCRDASPGSEFRDALKTELGAYALLPEPVLSSLMFDALADAGPVLVPIAFEGHYVDVNFLDRRIVGMDWLGEFVAPVEQPRRLVFGSLKGGVGRSTTVAVLAADLANRGKRVLCIDLDLEAPGLGSMLLDESPEDRRPKFGVIDYLVESGLGHVADDELYDHIGVSQFGKGLIDVLPATGRVTDENPANMMGKLARALSERMTPSGRQSLSSQIREMVDRFASRIAYDAILIDSRAGLAEATAPAWLGLGAWSLVLFGIDQPQTFHGYRYLFAHLIQTLRVAASPDQDDWRSRITFVQGKAPNAADKRELFRENLHNLCADILYDQDEGPESDGGFNFALSRKGAEVPHDASFVQSDPGYAAFDPVVDRHILSPERYGGSFSDFLIRAWALLGLEVTP
jgi:hypothetical protein